MNIRLSGALLLLAVSFHVPTVAQSPGTKAPEVLPQQRMEELVPATVFFAGKTATTQVRNSGGIVANGDKVTEFVLVDASGYSTGIRERYQFYLLTSTPVEIAGKRLAAGAYGGGFVSGHVVLMDLGAKDIFQMPLQNDAEMKRPRPLTVAAAGGDYRLYLGREYVAFRQVAQ